MIRKLHVFDFDGTLVDSSHRYRTAECGTRIDLAHWRANAYRAADDKPLPLLHRMNAMRYHPAHFCMIATARVWDSYSQDYVCEHGIDIPVVARLGDWDTRSGVELKVTGIRQWLSHPLLDNVREIHVYEDNLQYLHGICAAFPNTVGHYCPSTQGH